MLSAEPLVCISLSKFPGGQQDVIVERNQEWGNKRDLALQTCMLTSRESREDAQMQQLDKTNAACEQRAWAGKCDVNCRCCSKIVLFTSISSDD